MLARGSRCDEEPPDTIVGNIEGFCLFVFFCGVKRCFRIVVMIVVQQRGTELVAEVVQSVVVVGRRGSRLNVGNVVPYPVAARKSRWFFGNKPRKGSEVL